MNKTKHTVLLKKILLSIMLLFVFTACGNNNEDENKLEVIVQFLDNEVEACKGLETTLSLTLDGYYKQSEMSLFVGDIKIDSFKIGQRTKDGVTFNVIEFSLPKSVTTPSEANVALQIKDKRHAGPKLKIGLSFYSSLLGNEKLGRLNMAMASIDEGKIVSVSDGMIPGPLKKATFRANGIDNNYFPVMDYTWSSDFALPQSPSGTNPVSTISGNRMGMDIRNGITYFPVMYSPKLQKPTNYLAQEYRGIVDFCGSDIYIKPTFEEPVSDVRVDGNGNIYVIDGSKPNCIQKLSVTKSPEIWVGSATESGSVDAKGKDARFENVVSLQRDSKDNLYVAQKNVIRKITPDGTVSTLSKFSFQDILAFTVAPDDKIYVLDAKDQTKLTIIDAAQTESIFARILDKLNPGSTYLIYAQNMAVGTDGVVYFRRFSSGTKNSNLNVLIPY